jgi:hypothetical protein
MAFPIVGAIFFASFIFISLARRRKKSKMILGIRSNTSPGNDSPLRAPATDPSTGNSLPENLLDETEHELDTSVLSGGQSTPALSTDVTSAATATNNVDAKTLALDAPPPNKAEKIDLAARLPNSQLPPTATAPQEPKELMRLLRDPQSGQLIVEIAGQRYTKLSDIVDKELGQYILKVAAHLLAFTAGKIATEAGVKSVYMPRVAEAPEPIVAPLRASQMPEPLADTSSQTSVAENSETNSEEPPLVPRPSPEAEAKFLASIRNQPPPTPLEDPPQRQGLFGRVTTSPEPILPGLNLADEINKIVQTRLIVSPLAESTEIEITADPGGGIRIKVNDTYYSGPDDIPDHAVKRLIKASIKQWERS